MKNEITPNQLSSGEAADASLLLKTDEVTRLLGNISKRSLARLEKRGLITPVPLLRHKLYSRASVNSLVKTLESWSANS